jgi:hypothetical protein
LRRSYLLKNVKEGKIEGAGRRGRRRKQLMDDFNNRRYRTLKEEALARILLRTHFEIDYGPVSDKAT